MGIASNARKPRTPQVHVHATDHLSPVWQSSCPPPPFFRDRGHVFHFVRAPLVLFLLSHRFSGAKSDSARLVA
jgi:hypothetical protein